MDYDEKAVAGLEQNVIDHIHKGDKLVFDSTGFVSQNVYLHCDCEETRRKYWMF